MKRRVLCVFILVFWALIICTFLSVRIEEMMILIISTIETDGKDLNPSIPADTLFYDETGMHPYRAYHGSGWEDGLRIYEENLASYHVDGELLRLELQGKFVRYSTRNLRLGEEVILWEAFQRADDIWIAVFPGGVPAYTEVSDKVQVIAQTDDAVMLAAPR